LQKLSKNKDEILFSNHENFIYFYKFSQMRCVYTLILFLAYLLRKRVCTDSRNVNNKYCIVTEPSLKSLQ